MAIPSLNHIGETIATDIHHIVDGLCIHYRLHWRAKEQDSLKNKIESKGVGYYSQDGKRFKMFSALG